MTGRERILTTVQFREPDRPPHFEEMFELTVEAFGRDFPSERAIAEASGEARARLLPLAQAPQTEELTVTESVSVTYRGPRVQADAPACASCGWIMSRSGTCYRCENCGSTSGCS